MGGEREEGSESGAAPETDLSVCTAREQMSAGWGETGGEDAASR